MDARIPPGSRLGPISPLLALCSLSQVLHVAADGTYSAWLPQLRSFSSLYAASTSVNVTLSVPPGSFLSFLEAESQRSALAYSDAYVASSTDVVQLAETPGMLSPLEPLLFQNLSLDWYGIAQAYRLTSARFAGATWGVPLSGASVLLYYRSDVLPPAQVPRTWQQLLALAKAYQGKDLNRDGQADYSFCFQRGAGA